MPVFSSVSSGRHSSRSHCYTNSPSLHCERACVPYTHKVICFSSGSNHSARWKHLLAGPERGEECVARCADHEAPTLPSKPWSESGGLEFQTKCPLIHYTCNCTENLLPQHHLLSSLPLSSFFFFSRQNIHKVWIKLMTSRAALWKSHC